jgi:hypothetical protein
VTTLFIVQFFPMSCYLLSLISEYSLQHVGSEVHTAGVMKADIFWYSLPSVFCSQIPSTYILKGWEIKFHILQKQCRIITLTFNASTRYRYDSTFSRRVMCDDAKQLASRRQIGCSATYRFSFGHGSHFEFAERIIGKGHPIPLR